MILTSRLHFFILSFQIRPPGIAGEIQHILGGFFETLIGMALLLFVLSIVVPALYYYRRTRLLAKVAYVDGAIMCLLGLLIALNGSTASVVIALYFLVVGAFIIRLPAIRPPFNGTSENTGE